MLRYGLGQALRIGRATCSHGGNNVQLVGSAKVSRHHACVEWNVERSSFCVTDLSSVGLLLDGRKIAPQEPTPIPLGSTLAFYGNPAWQVGHQADATPSDAFRMELCSMAPAGSQPRWELPSAVVSRKHCLIECDATGACVVTDCESHGGTRIDGIRLTPGQRATMLPNSEITLGDPLDARALAFVLEPT